MPENMFLHFEGFRMLSSHPGPHLNFMNPCKGGKNASCKHSISCNSSFALKALVYIASVLAIEFALFNPLFMEVLRINKWIHELDPQKGRVQIYAGMKIGPL